MGSDVHESERRRASSAPVVRRNMTLDVAGAAAFGCRRVVILQKKLKEGATALSLKGGIKRCCTYKDCDFFAS